MGIGSRWLFVAVVGLVLVAAAPALAGTSVAAGVFAPTRGAQGWDLSTGAALAVTYVGESGWYIGGEWTRYSVAYSQSYPTRLSMTGDCSTWAIMFGPLASAGPHGDYVGVGLGFSGATVDVVANGAVALIAESPTHFAWEIIAGTERRVGFQARFRNGGMPANTGITLGLSAAW